MSPFFGSNNLLFGKLIWKYSTQWGLSDTVYVCQTHTFLLCTMQGNKEVYVMKTQRFFLYKNRSNLNTRLEHDGKINWRIFEIPWMMMILFCSSCVEKFSSREILLWLCVCVLSQFALIFICSKSKHVC